MNILSIIVFIICLSIVVCLHELGHLIAAKASNVYCHEFSIGFGPCIYKHKFKHKVKNKKQILTDDIPLYEAENENEADKKEYVEGETTFSIRALPLGGYVAMAGENDAESDANFIVPKERTLEGVNHFKQLCIMLAGIAMNFILAWLLFFCCFAFCTQQKGNYSSNTINVVEKINDKNSAVYDAGLKSGDYIVSVTQTYSKLQVLENNVFNESTETVEFKNENLTSYLSYVDDKTSGYVYEYSKDCISYAVQDITSRRWQDRNNVDKYYQDEFQNWKKFYAGANSTRDFDISYKETEDGEIKHVKFTSKTSEVTDGNESYYVFDKIGIEPTITKYKVGFVNAFKVATDTFNRYFVNIYVSLGSLFTPQGWKSVGGIISVYKVSASGFTSGSIGYFITLWGFISLNLGCFNLLPFPGLDGWQALIAIIESVTRKKIPSKVKNVANTVGLLIMFALAGLLIIKDLVRPISVIRVLLK